MACTCALMLTDKWAFIGAGVRHLYASSIFTGRHMGTKLHLLYNRDFEMSGKRSDTWSHSPPPPDKSIS